MVHTCKFDLLSGPYLSTCLPLDLELKVVLKLNNSLTPYACKSGSGGFKIDYTYLGFAFASHNFLIGAIDG